MNPPRMDRLLNAPFSSVNPHYVTFIVVGLILSVFNSPAFSQSCGPEETVKKLLKHSHLAERLEDQQGYYDVNSQCANHVPDRDQIYLPNHWNSEEFASVLQEVVGTKTNRETFVEDERGSNTLRVGCRDLVDWAVEMRFYREQSTGADSVLMQVVGKVGEQSDADWEIPVLRDGIVTIPGTDFFDPSQIRSNFSGQECAFPAVKYTLFKICEDAKEHGKEAWLRLDEDDRLIVVGHSLGGSAAQFIASSWPSSVSEESYPECPGVDAYAFGSTGLEPATEYPPTIHGSLISYISSCDQLVRLFPRVQAGHLLTLSPTSSHSIDSIQGDLCNCLNEEGDFQFNDYGTYYPPENSRLLCLN